VRPLRRAAPRHRLQRPARADQQGQPDEALEACRQAASAQPARGRYAYLYGRALWNGFQRYDEAVKQFAAAREAGNPWGALGLGTAYATGNGVAQTAVARCACTARPKAPG
jgi:tetratricopeptide (TPR) repeat protein